VLPPQQGSATVPRYFFNIVDGKFLPDDTGTECADLAAMRAAAIEAAGAILRDLSGKFRKGTEWQRHVTDSEKNTVFRVRFSAEDVEPPPC